MEVSQDFSMLSQERVAAGESAPFPICFSPPSNHALTMHSTPYPSFQQPLSPWPPPSAEPPNSAQSWSYGQYGPSGAPPWLPAQPPPGWGQTPASPWAPTTPAGTWGALSPTAPFALNTPSGYPGSAGYGSRPQTPYFGPNPPGTPYHSSSGQPITAGWFGAENGYQKKKKKRHSFGEHSWGGEGWDWNEQNGYPLRRSNSIAASNPHIPLQRSASWGHLNTPTYTREPYNTLNLARRPKDWRPDYTPREGIAALAAHLPRLVRSKSDVRGLFYPILFFLTLTATAI